MLYLFLRCPDHVLQQLSDLYRLTKDMLNPEDKRALVRIGSALTFCAQFVDFQTYRSVVSNALLDIRVTAIDNTAMRVAGILYLLYLNSNSIDSIR